MHYAQYLASHGSTVRIDDPPRHVPVDARFLARMSHSHAPWFTTQAG